MHWFITHQLQATVVHGYGKAHSQHENIDWNFVCTTQNALQHHSNHLIEAYFILSKEKYNVMQECSTSCFHSGYLYNTCTTHTQAYTSIHTEIQRNAIACWEVNKRKLVQIRRDKLTVGHLQPHTQSAMCMKFGKFLSYQNNEFN